MHLTHPFRQFNMLMTGHSWKRASDTLLPQVGVLVNNAGMITPHRWDQQTWDDIMAVNYTGAISLAEQILPVLAEGALARSGLCV
jgi:NAD(P)-dependent dehydrogenase (short-subunit alcohol dehydrogenase family)